MDSSSASGLAPLRVGVLALQGSFREHIAALRRCAAEARIRSKLALEAVEVRKPAELVGLHGLIIPGGESTTMAHVAERNGMIPALREFEAAGAPIWGTCAGLIFLADRALGQKMGGQALLGGLDCTVHRNFFGSQINSFETDLPAPLVFSTLAASQASESAPERSTTANPGPSPSEPPSRPFRAVFIRAPAIVETGPQVEVLSEYRVRDSKPELSELELGKTEEQAQLEKLESVAVAVKQGQLLATAFHPELTSDLRWHLLFIEMVVDHVGTGGAARDTLVKATTPNAAPNPEPVDLPVYGPSGNLSIELKY